MARKNRKQRQRRESHAEYLYNNVHYLPQAQKQKQVRMENINQDDTLKIVDPKQDYYICQTRS